MKLIAVDNYNRENVADVLIAENLTDWNAKYLATAANEYSPGDRFYKAVADDHKLWRGMEELV